MQSMRTGAVGQDGPVGSAALRDVLRRYDANARRWMISKDSDFWRTVAMAHVLGIRGAGTRIAIIDGGFDRSLPALQDAPLLGENPLEPAARLHGTIVALLVLEVAPEAQLELHAVRGEQGIDLERAGAAFATATANGADIINLSIGQQHTVDLRAAVSDWLTGIERWPEMQQADFDFWVADALGRADRWAPFLTVPADALVEAARAARERGVTVVAAAGNAAEHCFTPAVDPAAISVGFMRERRSGASAGKEVAVATGPRWYDQTTFVDVSIVQPLELLGSSLAAPLVAGAAALMPEPEMLGAYRRVASVGALASSLVARPDGARWSRRQVETTCELFLRALNASPHRHVTSGIAGPCVDCALWEVQVLNDFGLFHLERRSVDEARRFLACAVDLAPENPHARGNLGMALAQHAVRAVDQDRVQEASALLAQAAEHYATSTRIRLASDSLRADAWKYEARQREFAQGSADPALWRTRFDAHAERHGGQPDGRRSTEARIP